MSPLTGEIVCSKVYLAIDAKTATYAGTQDYPEDAFRSVTGTAVRFR